MTGLVQRMKTGDEQAFRELYDSLNMVMYNFTKTFVKDRDVARDITVETFAKAWKLKGNFTSLGDLKAFLFVTNRNRAYDYLRYGIHYGHKKEIFQDLQETSPAYPGDTDILAAIIESELLEQIYLEMEQLPMQRRKVLSMYFVEDLTTEEIASRLNVSVSTVRATKADALRQLRTQMLAKKLISLLAAFFCGLATWMG
jgi:RNA polymerase sigma-70 factor (ECF subfamily)